MTGTELRDLRMEHGQSLQQLASAIGCSRSLLSYCENGHRIITEDTARKVRDFYDRWDAGDNQNGNRMEDE